MTALLRFVTSARVLWLVLPLLVLLIAALSWLADLFWFQAVGYAQVFWRLLLIRLALFAAATGIVFLYAWTNLRLLARRVDLIGQVAAPGSMAQILGAAPAVWSGPSSCWRRSAPRSSSASASPPAGTSSSASSGRSRSARPTRSTAATSASICSPCRSSTGSRPRS